MARTMPAISWGVSRRARSSVRREAIWQGLGLSDMVEVLNDGMKGFSVASRKILPATFPFNFKFNRLINAFAQEGGMEDDGQQSEQVRMRGS
eukprot:scaffold27417_cov42-Cyclotella_meneghiniana.AAC.2